MRSSCQVSDEDVRDDILPETCQDAGYLCHAAVYCMQLSRGWESGLLQNQLAHVKA